MVSPPQKSFSWRDKLVGVGERGLFGLIRTYGGLMPDLCQLVCLCVCVCVCVCVCEGGGGWEGGTFIKILLPVIRII